MDIQVLQTILLVILVMGVVVLLVKVFSKKEVTHEKENDVLLQEVKTLQRLLSQDNQHLANQLQQFQQQHMQQLQLFQNHIAQHIKEMQQQHHSFNTQSYQHLQHLKQEVNEHLNHLRLDNAQQLDRMRATVDEKLQKTLNDRLSHSFEIVQKQLITVQESLGAMQNIAQDVGGLKKVLSNVKLRGGIGEVQLGMILEQYLAADQYAYQVRVHPENNLIVEYAIKLPGNTDNDFVWIPIDSKFPKDIYEQLVIAYEQGDAAQILVQQKSMEVTLKKMAKDIHDKYIHPPYTTGFALLFLPFESIYAEVIRNTALVDAIQQEYSVIITGPNTITALLNSLQMGFKTLAIQKRSQEVWQILAGVKKEFANFEQLMHKAQNNIQTGLNQLDELVGRRTRAIQKQLKDVDQDHNPPLL